MTNMTDPHTCPTCGVDLVLAGVLFTECYFLKFTREMVGGAAVEVPALDSLIVVVCSEVGFRLRLIDVKGSMLWS